jgi:hypothetical protein
LYLIRHVNSRHSLHESGKELVIGGAGQSEGPQGGVEGPQLPAHLLVHLPRHQEHCVLVNKNEKTFTLFRKKSRFVYYMTTISHGIRIRNKKIIVNQKMYISTGTVLVPHPETDTEKHGFGFGLI